MIKTYAGIPLVEGFDVQIVQVLRWPLRNCIQRTSYHHVQAFGQLKLAVFVPYTDILIQVFRRNEGIGLLEFMSRFTVRRLSNTKSVDNQN